MRMNIDGHYELFYIIYPAQIKRNIKMNSTPMNSKQLIYIRERLLEEKYMW